VAATRDRATGRRTHRRSALLSAGLSLVLAVSVGVTAFPAPPPAATDPVTQDPLTLSRPVPPSRPCLDDALVAGTITVDGVARTYRVSVPTSRGGRAPLVLAFHGLAERTGEFATRTGLCQATRAAGQLLVLPDSAGPAFNDSRLGRRGPHDDAFALALIDRYVRLGLADRNRVTLAGFSNGAGMAMAVAAQHPTRIAAVVSVAGSLIRASDAPRPTGPVPVVLVHGSNDPVQPWNGRRGHGRYLPSYLAVPATADSWVVADRCRGAVRMLLPAPVADPAASLSPQAPNPNAPSAIAPGRMPSGAVEVTRWLPGPQGAGVTFYRVIGGRHRWPVTDPAQVGPGTELAAVSATQLVVDTVAHAHRSTRRTS